VLASQRVQRRSGGGTGSGRYRVVATGVRAQSAFRRRHTTPFPPFLDAAASDEDGPANTLGRQVSAFDRSAKNAL
jgi:hypothetical protein